MTETRQQRRRRERAEAKAHRSALRAFLRESFDAIAVDTAQAMARDVPPPARPEAP